MPTWHDAAAAADLPPGAVLEAVADGRVIALANVEGEVFALDGVCSHQGGPLGKAKLEGCTLTCPWHGWQYDARSGRQLLSETIAQRVYAARITGDRIEVAIDG